MAAQINLSRLTTPSQKDGWEIVEIMDHETVGRVHSVGHDLGSHLLGRMANWYPDRFLSLSFLIVPYMPPGQVMDLDMVNGMTKDSLGV
jgi:soluble epoxide hydrolase/lipid-phosphate phosphatase